MEVFSRKLVRKGVFIANIKRVKDLCSSCQLFGVLCIMTSVVAAPGQVSAGRSVFLDA